MRTSVAGYRISIAVRYWHCARVVLANQIRAAEFMEPVGFLLGMASELTLKAFLLDVGMSDKILSSKKFGHDLRALLRECLKKGLELSPYEAMCVLNMRDAHFTHFNRYGAQADEDGVPTGIFLLTDDDKALSVVAALIDRVAGDPDKLRAMHQHPEKLDWPITLPVLFPVNTEELKKLEREISQKVTRLAEIEKSVKSKRKGIA